MTDEQQQDFHLQDLRIYLEEGNVCGPHCVFICELSLRMPGVWVYIVAIHIFIHIHTYIYIELIFEDGGGCLVHKWKCQEATAEVEKQVVPESAEIEDPLHLEICLKTLVGALPSSLSLCVYNIYKYTELFSVFATDRCILSACV